MLKWYSRAKLYDEAGEHGADESSAGLSESDIVDVDSGSESIATEVEDSSDGGSDLPSEPVEQEDPYRHIFDAAREAGYDLTTKYQSGKDAVNGLINAYRAVGKRDQDAELGRRLKPYYGEIEQYLQSKLQQPQQAQAPESPYDIPQLPQQVLRYAGRDEHGNLVIADSAPQDIKAAFDNWQRRREDFAYNLTTNPREALINPLREQIKQEMSAEFQQMLEYRDRQQRSEALNRQVLSEVTPWLWQTDANGNRVMGFDSNGNEAPVYTQRGYQYAQMMHDLAAGGMTDVARMHQVAMRALGPVQETPQPPQQTVPPGGRATKTRSAKPLDNTQGMDLADILRGEGWNLDE